MLLSFALGTRNNSKFSQFCARNIFYQRHISLKSTAVDDREHQCLHEKEHPLIQILKFPTKYI